MSRWKKDSIVCRIFGHRMPLKGWWGDGLYGEVRANGTDGTGRSHYYVMLECPRCKHKWTTARFHGWQVENRHD